MFGKMFTIFRPSDGRRRTSLLVRTFAFFAFFALALMSIAFLALTAFGMFDIGGHESRTWLESEMEYLKGDVSGDFSRLSLRGVSLSRQLGGSGDAWARQNGVSLENIAARPELIESFLAEQSGSLMAALDNNQCSGAFVILDATVNPSVPGAAYSRAGLYYKRTESNNLTALSGTAHFLRGPASVARRNGVELMGQWKMEFDVSDADFYEKVLTAARENSGADLSRLYYWTRRYTLNGDNENAMLLCVPLISGEGAAYGICGMEVSSLLFKRLYSPDNAKYPHVFSALAPAGSGGGEMDTGGGLIAGNSYLTNQTIGLLAASGEPNGVAPWRSHEVGSFMGMMDFLRLYPAGSPFYDEIWMLAVLMSDGDWEAARRRGDIIIYSVMAALLLVSLLAALLISRRYVSPVTAALELINAGGRAKNERTHIAEIDDLMEYLASLDDERQKLGDDLRKTRQAALGGRPAPQNAALYENFLENLKALTVTERTVFNLYLEKRTAQEIAAELFVSLNTIRFHNRNIYAKLGVSSLKELMVYAKMMGISDPDRYYGALR